MAWRSVSAAVRRILPRGSVPSGTIAAEKPNFAHSARRRSAWLAGRRRPVSPTSPKHARPSRTRTPRAAEAIASAIAEVGRRLVDPHTAGHIDEDVRLSERDTRVPSEDGDDHGQALRVDAGGDAARHREVARRDERLDLEEERARPFERADDRRSRLVVLRAAEDRGRVVHPLEPRAGHLEDAQLVRRAEAVLDGAEDPMGAVAVALELEHAVDEVLEHARSRDRTLLRHVPDEERGDSLLLGDAEQAAGRFADLRDRTGGRARARAHRASAPSR